jgi:hypothetical protein
MPRTRTLAWSQLKIGILAVAAFALATMLIFAVGGDAGIFSGRYHLKTRFPNAGPSTTSPSTGPSWRS